MLANSPCRVEQSFTVFDLEIVARHGVLPWPQKAGALPGSPPAALERVEPVIGDNAPDREWDQFLFQKRGACREPSDAEPRRTREPKVICKVHARARPPTRAAAGDVRLPVPTPSLSGSNSSIPLILSRLGHSQRPSIKRPLMGGDVD